MNKKTISLLKQLTVLTLSDELQWRIFPMPIMLPPTDKQEKLQFEASTRFYGEKRKLHQIDIKSKGFFVDNELQKGSKNSSILKELVRLLKLKVTKIMWDQLYGETIYE